MALDQLAIGTRAGEPAACGVDHTEPFVVSGRGARFGIDQVAELVAPARDEALGEDAPLGYR